jgi:addiction module RelE/StbE family toxin
VRLLLSSTFARTAKKTIKKDPSIAPKLKSTLKLLESDHFHPRLRTHKLKGALEGSMACSVDRDLRVIFEIVEQVGEQMILLQTLGTHDEVY